MNTWTLRELGEASWILLKNDTMTALVSATADGLKLLGPLDRKRFDSADEMAQFLGGTITVESRESDETGDEVGLLDGYPIKHKAAYDIEMEPLVSYTKIAGSKSRFAAGYFGLEFGHGWTAAYCPRLVTLAEYNHIGPFRTKLEMQNAMAQKKRISKV